MFLSTILFVISCKRSALGNVINALSTMASGSKKARATARPEDEETRKKTF